MIKFLHRGSSTFYFNNQSSLIHRLAVKLKRRGILLTDEDPDVLWVYDMPYIDELLDLDIPTIIEERYLGPEIHSSRIRELLHSPHIKTLVKVSSLKDWRRHNEELHYGFAHCHELLSVTPDEVPQLEVPYPIIGKEQAKKIFTFGAFSCWEYFHSREWPEPDFRIKRLHDVHLVLGDIFNGCYPIEIVRTHRITAHKVVSSLPYKLCHRKLEDPQWSSRIYLDSLRTSKVCLSPWGYDPMCFRDYEAALCGCIVIKPNTDFLETWPSLRYVSCKPDFSDLVEVIESTLSKWEELEGFRREAYFNVKESLNDDIVADRVASIVRGALK